MKAMPPSLSGVYHDMGLVEGPRTASPGESCAQAPWSHRPDFDQANCNKAPFLPEFVPLGWNTGDSCVQAPWCHPDFDQANCYEAPVIRKFASLGWNAMLLPRDDAKGLAGASRRITRTPAEYIAFKNGRITRTPAEPAAYKNGRITRTPAEYVAFNGRITPCTPAEQYVACNGRAKGFRTTFALTARTSAAAPAARGAAASPVKEELLNTNITPDTTLYDHYQPHQQQHSEEVALEQRGRTVSSTSSSTSLLLEKNKEQEEPAYYDSSRYGGCFTPLPEDFPPPSPEEWEEIIMVVRDLV